MRITRYFCWFYVSLTCLAILFDGLIGLLTQYGNRIGIGCNFYDALIIGIECRGFVGAKVAELFLNWSLSLFYMLLFSFSSLWFAIPTIILWFPPLFLLGDYIKKDSVNISA